MHLAYQACLALFSPDGAIDDQKGNREGDLRGAESYPA